MKKRVERSSDDPTIVVTTYEGQHTHQSPITPRSISSLGILQHSESVAAQYGGFGSVATAVGASLPLFGLPQIQNHQHHQHPNYISPSTLNNINIISSGFINLPGNIVQERYSHNLQSSASLLRDHGLLQDIVPSQMRKDENKEE